MSLGENTSYVSDRSSNLKEPGYLQGKIIDPSSAPDDPKTYIQQMTNCMDKLMLLVILMLNPLLGLLRGTKSFDSLIENKICSSLDFIIMGTYLIIVITMTIINGIRLSKRNKGV